SRRWISTLRSMRQSSSGAGKESRKSLPERSKAPRPIAPPTFAHRKFNLRSAKVGSPVDLPAPLAELLRLLPHPHLQGLFLLHSLLRGVLADFLGDLHRAEVGTTHGAEMGHLGAFLGEGLVVVLAGGVRIEGEIELVLPAELEAGLGEGVVTDLG